MNLVQMSRSEKPLLVMGPAGSRRGTKILVYTETSFVVHELGKEIEPIF